MKKIIKRTIIGLVVVTILLAIVGAFLPATADQKREAEVAKRETAKVEKKVWAYPPNGGNAGNVVNDQGIFETGDDEANRRVTLTDYYCRWNDGRVEIHVVITNPMAAHVTVHLQPSYRLLNAGLHGDGYGSGQDIGVNATSTREYTHRLDKAEGVDGTPEITACSPEYMGTDLG